MNPLMYLKTTVNNELKKARKCQNGPGMGVGGGTVNKHDHGQHDNLSKQKLSTLGSKNKICQK